MPALPFLAIGFKFARGAAEVVARTAQNVWRLPAATKKESFGNAMTAIKEEFQDDITELVINQLASPIIARSLAHDLEVLILQGILENDHIDTGRMYLSTRVTGETNGRIDDFELKFLVHFPTKNGVAYGFIVNSHPRYGSGFLDTAFREFTRSNSMETAIGKWSSDAAKFKLNLNNRPGPLLIGGTPNQ